MKAEQAAIDQQARKAARDAFEAANKDLFFALMQNSKRELAQKVIWLLGQLQEAQNTPAEKAP
jgi:hypothetical protein